MRFTALPMPELWRRLAQNEAFAAFSLVTYTTSALPFISFSAAFAEAVKRAEEEGALLPSTRRILLAFGEGCGQTDIDGQRTHIEYYRTLLSAQEEESRRLWQEKGRVYRMLGLTGGVALMLLLM